METPAFTTIRTYENFSIRWDRGSTWTGYQSADMAQLIIDGCTDDGTVERHTWEVEVIPQLAHIYKPGISERVA